MSSQALPLLSVCDVSVRLHGARHATRQSGGRRILNKVSIEVAPGQIVGLIGETGSGKTTLARTIVGLVPATSGSILFEDRDLSLLSRKARRLFRRLGSVQFVFQDPLRSLDPDMSVQQLVGEGLAIQDSLSETERDVAIEDALKIVGLDKGIATRRPAQISGGQRQRVSIARAVVMKPRLILCDEPVSALDASTRNFVLRILSKLRDDLGLALLIISHDLASLAGVADRVAVLYRGHIVEEGPTDLVFRSARHPYTALLIASSPSIAKSGQDRPLDLEAFGHDEGGELDETEGCPFVERCPFATDICHTETPVRTEILPGWEVACHHAAEWRVADQPT
jgi:oligopeptide/dipeptide ABC transporter ATP-binding protein